MPRPLFAVGLHERRVVRLELAAGNLAAGNQDTICLRCHVQVVADSNRRHPQPVFTRQVTSQTGNAFAQALTTTRIDQTHQAGADLEHNAVGLQKFVKLLVFLLRLLRCLSNAEALQDMETGDRIPIVPAQQHAQYRRLVQEHIDALRHASGGRGIDYACFDTSQPLDHILFRYLSERARLAHVR